MLKIIKTLQCVTVWGAWNIGGRAAACALREIPGRDEASFEHPWIFPVKEWRLRESPKTPCYLWWFSNENMEFCLLLFLLFFFIFEH